MNIYPFSQPIILTNALFVRYGGAVGGFNDEQLTDSFLVAEILATSYIGTPLLPVIITGTMNYMGTNRLSTEYGYVHEILSVGVLSKQTGNCILRNNNGCAYIYDDTFGYVDFKQLSSYCGCAYPFYNAANPYQVQIAYMAGLPTGTANLSPVVQALTILAQIDLNEKIPGMAGMNEGVGDVRIEKYSSMDDYHEERAKSSMMNTNLGGSAKAMYAKRLLDGVIKRARKTLLV